MKTVTEREAQLIWEINTALIIAYGRNNKMAVTAKQIKENILHYPDVTEEEILHLLHLVYKWNMIGYCFKADEDKNGLPIYFFPTRMDWIGIPSENVNKVIIGRIRI
jgi:hypothetical protein